MPNAKLKIKNRIQNAKNKFCSLLKFDICNLKLLIPCVVFVFAAFFLASPTYAAKLVPGVVPDVKPLQPPAAGINANYSKNIQYADPTHQARPSEPQKEVEQAGPIKNDLVASKHSYTGWALGISIILGCGALYLVWKNTRKP